MVDPLWINVDSGAPEYTANEMRAAMALALMYGGRLVGARQGVRPGGNQMQVSLAGSTITVQPGVACVDPGLSTPQGPYWVALTAAANPEGGPLDAADPTNPRKDIVVLRVYDDDEDSSGLRTARTEYIAGTAAAVPAEPSVPAGAVKLATIDVPAGGSPAPSVTNNVPFTTAAGGILPVRSATERDAASAAGTYDGLTVWRTDRNWLESDVNGASGWRVNSLPLVSSVGDLAAITNPFNGLVVLNTGDGLTYRYTGSAWIPMAGLIGSQVLGSTAASVTFSSIPSGLRALRLSITARGDAAGQFVDCRMRFNGDTGANYDAEQVSGNGATVVGIESLGATSMLIGDLPATTPVAGSASSWTIHVPWYAGTNFWKLPNISQSLAAQTSAGQANALWSKHWAGRWRSAAAITSITLFPSGGNFVAGSSFALEGL